ncbi:MAG: hypothetical protein ACOC4M_17960 [Promethearchaeia archaeon]
MQGNREGRSVGCRPHPDVFRDLTHSEKDELCQKKDEPEGDDLTCQGEIEGGFFKEKNM